MDKVKQKVPPARPPPPKLKPQSEKRICSDKNDSKKSSVPDMKENPSISPVETFAFPQAPPDETCEVSDELQLTSPTNTACSPMRPKPTPKPRLRPVPKGTQTIKDRLVPEKPNFRSPPVRHASGLQQQESHQFRPAVSMVGEEEENEDDENEIRNTADCSCHDNKMNTLTVEGNSKSATNKSVQEKGQLREIAEAELSPADDGCNYDASIIFGDKGKFELRGSYSHPDDGQQLVSTSIVGTPTFSDSPSAVFKNMFSSFAHIATFSTVDHDIHDLQKTINISLQTSCDRYNGLEDGAENYFPWAVPEDLPLSLTICYDDQSLLLNIPASITIADLSSKMVTESGWPISSSTHVFKLVAGADILHLDVPVPLAHLEAISIVINNTPLSSKEKGIPLVLRVIKRSEVTNCFAVSNEKWSQKDDRKFKFVPILEPPQTAHLVDLLSTLHSKVAELKVDVCTSTLQPFIQAVQALCFAASSIELKELVWKIQELAAFEHPDFKNSLSPSILDDILEYCKEVVAIFQRAVAPPATITAEDDRYTPEDISNCFAFQVESMHRLPPGWTTTYTLLRAQIGLYYGDSLIAPMIPVTSSFEARGQFFNTMFWKHNDWIETDSLLYRHLPLETRFVCFIDGAVADNGISWKPLGWGSIPLYDHHQFLTTGTVLLRINQEPFHGSHLSTNDILQDQSPFVLVRLRSFDYPVVYRTPVQNKTHISVERKSASAVAGKNPRQENDHGDISQPESLRPSHLPTPLPSLLEEEEIDQQQTSFVPPTSLQTYTALFDVVSPPLGYLTLYRGADVHIIHQKGEIWTGSLTENPDSKGYIDPKHLSSLPKPPEPAGQPHYIPDTHETTMYSRVAFGFNGESPSALFVEVDDIIAVHTQDGCWWYGTANGTSGWFPACYVEVAIQDFSGKTECDLDLQRGDELVVLFKQGTWCYGRNADEVGWCPLTHITEPGQEDIPVYEAIHNYQANYEDELTLSLAATVFVLQTPEGGWWQGRCNDRIGWFPSSHVQPKNTVHAKGDSSPSVNSRGNTVITVCTHQNSNTNTSVPLPLDKPERTFRFVASHSFIARNEDELSFSVGQAIVVEQQPDGGWWFGRVADKDGWFPANHVRPSTIDVTSISGRSSFKEVAVQLQSVIRQSTLERLTPADRKMIWMFRRELQGDPLALPRVVQAMPICHTPTLVEELEGLILNWAPPSPLEALELLQQSFADRNIRAAAVKWIERTSTATFLSVLPQLTQAVKFELFHCSVLAKLLIQRAVSNPRIAMFLFWTLRCEADHPLSGPRYQVLLDLLLSNISSSTQQEFAWQLVLVERLKCIHSKIISLSGNATRKRMLLQAMKQLASEIPSQFHLPLDPRLHVLEIKPERCSFFTSNALPLRLVFKSVDPAAEDIQCIFKCGDDLRQDTLVMQLVRFLNQTWLENGLDLNIITFRILPSDAQSGFIEIIQNAKTLREIHTWHGSARGSFNDRLLHEWLRQNNASPEQWHAAHDRFMRSCAGYCVATYLLGVCDRHNDNIMITRDGRLFHIDFGRFLKHAQKFGPINRDRVPFVLTTDMAYVINEGEKPTPHFQTFVDLCCQAYNLARAKGNTFLSLMMLMLQAGIPELQSKSDLVHVQDALKMDETDEAAMAHFTKMIQSSLSSKFTKINFFFHNLGQMKHASSSKGPILSFSPYSAVPSKEARVLSGRIIEFQKRYDLDKSKFYMYVIEVKRDNGTHDMVFRRFSEFNELNRKLIIAFGDSYHLPTFPSKIYVGRSHTRQIALKRTRALNEFLSELFALPDDVVQTQLVYTFFKPTPRDEVDKHTSEQQGSVTVAHPKGFGQVQLTIRYQSEEEILSIHVHHARGLRSPYLPHLPDPYVKTHILPSRQRDLKRKTSSKNNTTNPTFNETLVYKNFSVTQLSDAVLEVGLWTRDYGAKAICMGMCEISMTDPSLDLCNGTPKWFPLRSPTQQ